MACTVAPPASPRGRWTERTRAVVATVISAVVFGHSLSAQTTSPPPSPRIFQEVFVTTTIGSTPLESPARTVAVLTRDDLERIGVTSVIDALRFVPGVDVRARGPRDVQTDFSIRGSTFGQNLVLIDGIRLNNSQSGHHNGEIPAPLSAIDRIEVVYGAGSAVHGADALGGTINVISRQGRYAAFSAEGGQHGYAAAQASVSGHILPVGWSATAWGSRSSGFMFDRNFAQGGAALRATPRPSLTLDFRHQRRAFGANGFYGPSPSKEWTDQTLASVNWHQMGDRWLTTVRGSLRNHHDHFRWDIARPGFAENRHRTDAADVSIALERDLGNGLRATGGMSAGGDWITSSNLRDHRYAKTSVFGEVLAPLGAQATAQAGVRLEHYSNFGRSLSPSVSVAVRPAADLRLHASASRGFRIPTFTELYYSDPNHLASSDLRAERGWSLDLGAEWSRGDWAVSVAPFRRWDRDVIDWVRATTAERWGTTNVRDVTSTGLDLSVTRRWREALVRVHYSGLSVDAPALTTLSKYVLEYAQHQSGGSLGLPVGRGVRLAVNVDHRRRFDGQSYELVSARISRRIGHGDLYLDGSNLLNERYEEVAGVAMPGRWLTAGVVIR